MFVAILVPAFGIPLVLMSGERIFLRHSLFHFLLVAIVVMTICWRFQGSPILSWTLIGFISLLLKYGHALFVTSVERKLREDLPLILDRTILSMKSGLSMRRAFRETARELSPKVSQRVLEIADRLELSGSEDGLRGVSQEILIGFRRVEGAASKSIDRIESWRHNIRLRSEFRRKSSQATLQIRAQAVLTIALFVPAFVWNGLSGGQFVTARSLLALGMFALAQTWIHWLSGRFRWKI